MLCNAKNTESGEQLIIAGDCSHYMLKPFLSGLANFDALAPFGIEDLMGADSSAGVRIKN